MKCFLAIIGFLVFFCSTGCIVFSKKTTDNSIEKYLSKNPDIVKAAAEFAVGATYNSSKTHFAADEIADLKMRNMISDLGSTVTVYYKIDSRYELPDSNVTFKTITLFGVTEVVYDFATLPRMVPDDTHNRRSYYFVRLSDRIYYRRRPVPVM